MHQDLNKPYLYVGLLETVFYELDALLEILGDVEAFMILTWNILVEGHFGLGVAQAGPTGGSQHRLNPEF